MTKLSDIHSLDRFAIDGILTFPVQVQGFDPFTANKDTCWVGLAQGSSLEYVRDEVAYAQRTYVAVRVIALPSCNILFASTKARRAS